jgi:hypothetical protein
LSGGADSKDRIVLARPDSIYRAYRAVGRVWSNVGRDSNRSGFAVVSS